MRITIGKLDIGARSVFIYAGFIFIPLILIYKDVILSNIRWAIASENQWQFLIPPILFFMFWSKKEELKSMELKPSFSFGIPLLAIALSLHIAGLIFLYDYMIETSILFYVFGTSLLIAGLRITRLFAWPLFYVMLATTLFTYLQNLLIPYLQISAATCGVFILKSLGFDTIQNGTFFRLPGGILNVADACSGFNQLFTLAALAIPLCFLFLKKLSSQLIVLILTFPTSILMNSIRIACIGMWNYREIKKDVHGPYDIFYAPFIFLIGLIIIYMITIWLTRFERSLVVNKQTAKWTFKGVIIPTCCLISALTIVESAKIYLYRNKIKNYNPITINNSTEWSTNNISEILANINFKKNDNRLKADVRYLKQFVKNDVKVDLLYSWFSIQVPGNNVGSYTFPAGINDKCDISINNAGKCTFNCRTINTYSDVGTLFWTYSSGNQTNEIRQLKQTITKNMLTKGDPGASFILFYFPGNTGGISLKNYVEELYNGVGL